MDYRLERDLIGEKRVPKDAYYGIHSLRAYENFRITGLKINGELIKAVCEVKKAAAISNKEAGVLDGHIANAIIQACDEIIGGRLHDQFMIDPIQGGAGTSINMNANEVIANRAIEILGGEKGDYSIVHPIDHVNKSQSTNDVIPSAGKIATIRLLGRAIGTLKRLNTALMDKAIEFDEVIKMGRTQMQDAIPIRLGQEFKAYSYAIERDIERLTRVKDRLKNLNLGGTAIGTSLNANKYYIKTVVVNLSRITGLDLKQADDLIDATQNLDVFVEVSSTLKACAVNLSKISNDLRLMSSGPRTGFGEINLPPKQSGSSIMPGKVNPVIPEVMNQIAFNIMGNDLTITMAAEAGQLELNAFSPIIFYKLFESIESLSNGVETFVENCIKGITANKARCKELVNNSIGIITSICPYVGYKNASVIANKALKTGGTVKEIILKEKIMDESKLEEILDPVSMTEIV
ncbi:MAG: aspartate ammonia-lyase [Tissierellia bacterium]|nr:aspartate ammonia-lyase [Tissierellia bacterium]